MKLTPEEEEQAKLKMAKWLKAWKIAELYREFDEEKKEDKLKENEENNKSKKDEESK